jgi:diguanylate cyclase (GGDEF)-like protein
VSSLTPADPALPFATAYRQALVEYALGEAGEAVLMRAYELGRRAVAEQRNILDLVSMHQNILWSAVLSSAAKKQMDAYGCHDSKLQRAVKWGAAERQMGTYLRRGEEFLAEVLAPFEMIHRSYTATIHQLQEVNATLEMRVDERTLSLRESQRKTADLARLYLILSNINSAIVRLQDREELFKEACRIAVNQGGYPVAWINLRDSAGTDDDNWCHRVGDGSVCKTTPLDSIGAEVRAALDLVYAEGKPVVSHREGDSRVIWNGSSQGCSTYALLPLLLDGQVIGVFALFSAEPEAFKPEEMRLLSEMAGDLSFALDHIHKGERLNYLAYYDALTGLPNRSLLRDRLLLQLQAAERSHTIVALLLINLVHFSDVNDTYGHHVGDSVLKLVGARFCEATGNSETVARVGADRFALSLTNIAQTDQVAHMLEKEVLSSFVKPFRVDETDIHITVQVGISLFPSDATNVDTLYNNAEIALKRAQSTGESYLLYDAAMNERIIRSVTMQAKLRKAIEQGELMVHYQPKVSTANRRILGMEALLRYIDPESGMVLPDRFIALLEETGMIIEVGTWVMRRVAEDLRHWRQLELNPPRVAFNVSPIQLRQKNFIPSLRELVQESAGHSDGLDIEITESAIMEQVKENIPKLAAVREMGFRIAIDDFGTGYSSFSYLSQLPVHSLKIDRSFIVEMTERPNSLAIVTSIISLAHSLELEVIAEGVELEEQAKLLRLLRCDLIQGNLYSPPLPAEEIIALLRQDRI